MTPSYSSKAVLYVDPDELIDISDTGSADMRDLDILASQVDLITTMPVLDEVIRVSPELQEYYEVDLNDPDSIRSAASSIKSSIKARLRGDTLFIDITTDSKKSNLAYWIAKYTAKGFTSWTKKRYRSKTNEGVETLKLQQEQTQKELRVAQQTKLKFQKENDITNLEERLTLLDGQINANSTTLTQLNADQKLASLDIQTLESLGILPGKDHLEANKQSIGNNLESLILIESISQDVEFTKRYQDFKNASNKVKDLSTTLKDRHPDMLKARSEVENYRRVLVDTIAEFPDKLLAKADATKRRIDQLNSTMKDQQKEYLRLEELNGEYTILTQKEIIATAMVERIQSNIQDLEVTTDSRGNNIQIADEATKPNKINPNKNQTIMMGFLAGLGLSYGFLYLVNMMDKSIKSVEQAEQILQLPVLAAVPVSEPDGQQATSRLIMINSPNSTCSEAFRSLRVNIESMARQKSNKVVLFTSSMPSEGKTFTSINYAASLAQQGHRTLLIDMDLRKPAVGPEFKLKGDHVGVTDLLQSKEKLDQFPDLAIYEAADKFFVLHGGPHIDNPAEHLSGYAIEKIVEKAREHFDRVVIDSAPLGPVGDTLAVARLADMLCLVVRSAKTTSKVILRIIDTLHRHGHTPAGIVLNFLQNKTGKGSYYYYYSSDKEKEYTRSGYQRKQKTKESPKIAATDDVPKKKLSEFDNTTKIS